MSIALMSVYLIAFSIRGDFSEVASSGHHSLTIVIDERSKIVLILVIGKMLFSLLKNFGVYMLRSSAKIIYSGILI